MELIRNYKFVDTNAEVQKLIKVLSRETLVGLDIETSWKFKGKYNNDFSTQFGKEKNPNAEGLDPRLSTIIMVQIGTLDIQYVIDARKVDLLLLKPLLEDTNITFVGHNMKFEYKHFK